jgi:hypothetical protein
VRVVGGHPRGWGLSASYGSDERAFSGEPWSEADISDLKNELDYGRTIAKAASFLCRDAAEVREKIKELGLVEQPSKRRVVL